MLDHIDKICSKPLGVILPIRHGDWGITVFCVEMDNLVLKELVLEEGPGRGNEVGGMGFLGL
jgi:hypothetical protein